MHTRTQKCISGIFAVLCVVGILVHTTFAQTAAELQNKINDTQSQIAQLEREIADYQNQLVSTGREKNSLSKAITELDLTAKKLAADSKVTQKKIDAALLEKKKLSESITLTTNDIDLQKAAVAALIRKNHETEQRDLISYLVMPGSSLGDAWREIDTIQTLNVEFIAAAKKLHDDKTVLEGHKKAVEANERELRTLATNLANQKKVVDANAREKATLLKQTKNKEANYTALLKDRQAKKDAFEADVRNYESQLKFVLDPSAIPRAGSSVFGWPVDSVRITQLFGKTSASGRLYASGTHNGIDFGMPTGTPVHPVMSGTILGSGNTDTTCPGASYGNWVLVKHDNGLTTVYGHLSLVTGKTGARVTPDNIIAYSGSTGYATGPHLHVSAFVSSGVKIQTLESKACAGKVYTMPIAPTNAYLDPMLYFPKPTKAMLQYAA